MEVIQRDDMLLFPGKIIMDYSHAAGRVGSRFLAELKKSKRLLAIRCRTCNRVYIPPRLTCKTCFHNMEDWIELDGRGTLLTYTTVYYGEPVLDREAPTTYGIIRLDGADTGLVHFLNEVKQQDLRVGLRLEPVFKNERNGNILDIKYFRPIKSG
nr:Zn-ribbon domain-containing OB-fold protein [Desulfobacterales bacterium]